MPQTRRAKIKLALAETLARLVTYGGAGVLFCGLMGIAPLTLGPVLLLAAAQPWTGYGVRWLGIKLQYRFPRVMRLVDWGLGRWLGTSQWWTRSGTIISTVAMALVSAPHIFGRLPSWLTGVIGGSGALWAQLLPFALLTALPMTSRFASGGLDWLFTHTGLEDIAAMRQATRQAHLQAIATARQLLHQAGGLVGHEGAGSVQPPGGTSTATPTGAQPVAPRPAPATKVSVRAFIVRMAELDGSSVEQIRAALQMSCLDVARQIVLGERLGALVVVPTDAGDQVRLTARGKRWAKAVTPPATHPGIGLRGHEGLSV